MALMIGPPLGKIGGAELLEKTVNIDDARGVEVELLSAAEVGDGAVVIISTEEVRYVNSPSHSPHVLVGGEEASHILTDKPSFYHLDGIGTAGVFATNRVSVVSSDWSTSGIRRIDCVLKVQWVNV